MLRDSRRRYVGRHRVRPVAPVRAPRVLAPFSLLPAAAAVALVVSAGGVTLAQSAVGEPRTVAAASVIDLSAAQVVAVREAQAAEVATTADLAERRQAAVLQTSAVKGRVEATQRAARVAASRAAEAEKREAAARKKKAKAAAARAKAVRLSHRWVPAIRSGRLTSDFGPRWGKTHDGLDIGAPTGTPLYAMSKGTVILSDEVFSFGNKVEIRYWDGTVSWYGHLSRRDVETGDTVMPGERVGLVGNTGHSFGSHLHIEIHPTGGDRPVDPAPWLRKHGVMIG